MKEAKRRLINLAGIAAIAGTTFMSAGCDSGIQQQWKKTDRGQQMTAAKQLEAYMAEKAGLKEWMALVPLENLTPNQRTALGRELPQSGLFTFNETADGAKASVVYQTSTSYRNRYIYETPLDPQKVEIIIDPKAEKPEIRFNWDLSRFLVLDPNRTPQPGYLPNPYRIKDGYDSNPMDYLETNGAVTGIRIRGTEEMVAPLVQKMAQQQEERR